MARKDCDNLIRTEVQESLAERTALSRTPCVILALLAAFCGAQSTASAGTIRLWSSAVVVHDTLRLDEVCELKGFSAAEESALAELVVAEAPSPGGSRLIHMDLVRTVLGTSGINPAKVTISGATQCEVTRPANPAGSAAPVQKNVSGDKSNRAVESSPASGPDAAAGVTLKDAVMSHFQAELARYGGTAEVTLDRTPESVLALSGPAFNFSVRRRSPSVLGLCSIEVDVASSGRLVQTIPMVVQVSMMRRALVARRAINQGATISSADIELTGLSFSKLDRLGLDDPSQVIGQRAKQMVTAGTTLELDMLESVPLVLRGQIVTLVSQSGSVRIVTTAKAAQEGLRGETIKVRALDDKHVDYDAVVIAPGEVRIVGPASSEERTAAR